jgi:ABC-type multidrug transport system fused ATPase/permease subunit
LKVLQQIDIFYYLIVGRIAFIIQSLLKSHKKGSLGFAVVVVEQKRSFCSTTTTLIPKDPVYVVRAGLQFVRSYMAHVAGWGVVADLRKHIYEHMQRLTLRFYEDKQTGQMMSRVVNDTDLFERLIAHAIPDVLVNVITLIAISACCSLMNWQLALLSMVPIPLVIFSLRIYARYVRPAFRTARKSWAI